MHILFEKYSIFFAPIHFFIVSLRGNMKHIIRHEGTIESVSNGLVRVRIVQHSACAACQVAERCHVADSKEKIIVVPDALSNQRTVGQHVMISASDSAVKRALLLSFGLPLLILMVVLIALLMAHVNEGLAALAALLALIPYYLALWLCRKRIAGVVTFQIE